MANIMIIDDKSYMSSFISEDLNMDGHSISCYEDDYNAMEELGSHRTDIVLFDLYHRGFESWNILHRLKQAFPDIPVIILSAYRNFIDNPRVFEADGYVFKSIYTDELRSRIKEILARKEHLKKERIVSMINRIFTILIADDDPDDRFIAQKAFEDLGFSNNLRFAQDGVEVLDYLTQSASFQDHHYYLIPNFILLDLNMPVKDGWETLEEIKSSPELRDIPVVIWTTSSEAKDRLRSLEMGANAFITKPATYSNLLSNIRSLSNIYCRDPENEEMDISGTAGEKLSMEGK